MTVAADAPKDAPTPTVTVENRVNGRSVPDFPFKLFAQRVELSPAAARRVIAAFLAELPGD
jgi:hypothetical protein